MTKILFFIKKIIPKKLFKKIQPSYHLVLNWLATVWHWFPSEKLIVVGVTGTTGKTTTVFMIAEMLKSAGIKVGYTSTAMFSDGEKEWLNDKKMTMLGRFFTQRMLRQMVKNKCQVAIVETTSEGIVQNRHRFINYDIVEFTGLYPEHIDSHGSFENYKQAKMKLFEHLSKKLSEQSRAFRAMRSKRKARLLASEVVRKTIIVNLDDEYAGDFLKFEAERKIGFAREKMQDTISKIEINYKSQITNSNLEVVEYKFLEMNKKGTKFVFAEEEVQLNIMGEFNALNATAAGCVGLALGLNSKQIKKGLESIKNLPGRLERIKEGQDFTVIVDYAFEPVAVTKLYETIKVLEPSKIIHVLGSTGGGRDISRRAELGKIAGAKADYIIVTNEDPYDDEPMEIIKDVAQGVEQQGRIKNKNLFLIEDREQGIRKAIALAQAGDVVLITGKGSEQAIAGPNGKLIPWDDREIVKEIISSLIKND